VQASGDRDLMVWKKALDLAVASYDIARRLPTEERFALASQIRRSADSVPANIAEGSGRVQRREFARFLRIARGSLKELETHVEIARRVGYVDAADCAPALRLADEVSRMLTALRRSLT
jgi:four helix bundle protein